MIIAIVIVLALVAAIGFFAWQYQVEQSAALAAQVRIAEIQAQARTDYLDAMWPFAVLLAVVGVIAILTVAYVIVVTKRPRPVINDNRTVYLMLPEGQSRRQHFKALDGCETLPLAAPDRAKQPEKQPMKMLQEGGS